jgi:hypothetical protein
MLIYQTHKMKILSRVRIVTIRVVLVAIVIIIEQQVAMLRIEKDLERIYTLVI